MSEDGKTEVLKADYHANLLRITGIAGQRGYVLNADEERVKKVVGLMTRNYLEFGQYYCPCKQSHPLDPKNDVLCPCPELEQEVAQDGHCYCRLLYSA